MVKLNKQQIRNKQYEQKLIDENKALAEQVKSIEAQRKEELQNYKN